MTDGGRLEPSGGSKFWMKTGFPHGFRDLPVVVDQAVQAGLEHVGRQGDGAVGAGLVRVAAEHHGDLGTHPRHARNHGDTAVHLLHGHVHDPLPFVVRKQPELAHHDGIDDAVGAHVHAEIDLPPQSLLVQRAFIGKGGLRYGEYAVPAMPAIALHANLP